MRESTKKRWVPMAAVFLSVFGSFAALMYLSITTFSAGQHPSPSPFFRFQQNQLDAARPYPGFPVYPADTAAVAKASAPANGWSRVMIHRDKQSAVGNTLLTYRGRGEGSTFRLDAVIPALDSEYAYRQSFDIAKARNGFRVGGEYFELISAGRYKMRLRHRVSAK